MEVRLDGVGAAVGWLGGGRFADRAFVRASEAAGRRAADLRVESTNGKAGCAWQPVVDVGSGRLLVARPGWVSVKENTDA